VLVLSTKDSPKKKQRLAVLLPTASTDSGMRSKKLMESIKPAARPCISPEEASRHGDQVKRVNMPDIEYHSLERGSQTWCSGIPSFLESSFGWMTTNNPPSAVPAARGECACICLHACLCVCVCMYMYVYVACVSAHVCVCVCVCMFMCMCVRVRVCVCVCVCVCLCV
jgi:hypothetical protein